MSNIGKRFTDPSVWEKPYFTALDTKQRLFWLYLNNRCDLAGVFQLHFQVDSAYLGLPIEREFIKTFIEQLNSNAKRVEPLEGQRLWLKGFIRYQQVGEDGRLSTKAGPHKSIVKKLKEHGLFMQAVEDDPLLFSQYTGEVPENADPSPDDSNNDNKGNGRVSKGYHKGYSSSNSSNTGKGKSYSSPAANVDKAINPKSSLYYFNIVKQLKKIIPKRVRNNESDISLESEIKRIIEIIDVDNPELFILERAKKIDWNMVSVPEFFNAIETNEPETVF